MTDLEKFHALNRLPGFKFDSSLAPNAPSAGVGTLVAPEGETVILMFINGAINRVVSGDFESLYGKYKSQMDSIG